MRMMTMLVPIKEPKTPEQRAQADLLRNASSKAYCNERGFIQKLIDNLYKLGYYKDNESVFVE